MTSTSTEPYLTDPHTGSDPYAEPDADPGTDDELDARVDLDADAEPLPAASVPTSQLDERSQRILAFERQWWRHAGAKEQAIRDTFAVSSTRYYQLVNALLDDPAALVHDPVLVGRLRRLRARRIRPRRG